MYICPVCKAAAEAPCLFKVKDGHQIQNVAHIERIRLNYIMEILQPKRKDNETDLDFVMRVHEAITEARERPIPFVPGMLGLASK